MTTHENILDLSRTWYHGTHSVSALKISETKIDLTQSRELLDFGPGFYLTTNYEQAVKQAEFKGRGYNHKQNQIYLDTDKEPEYAQGAVMQYEISLEKLDQLKTHRFAGTGRDWASFILGNRTNIPNLIFHNRDKVFDAVYGPLADGYRIPSLILDFEEGIITPLQFAQRISRYEFPYNNQLSIHTEAAVSCLTLMEVKPIEIKIETPRPSLNPGR
ncbi:DUF3990 domain-containing protein [Peribacillus simplex]|nr:DUF3990 domain-containing protein [Peribacillus simplex]